MVLTVCTRPSLLFRPVRLNDSSAELFVDLDTFGPSVVRKGLDKTTDPHRRTPEVPPHPESDTSEGESPKFDSETEDGLDASKSDFMLEEGDPSAESDDDYGEWTGFGQSSEGDEDPTLPPTKLQETPAATPTHHPGSKYVPPHLRKTAADVQRQSSESSAKLTKQLKGLLNRYDVYLLPLLFTLTEPPV